MSYLNLSTNVSLEGVDTSSILSESSSTVAEIIGMPEAYVMIVLNGSVPTVYGGTEGPFAYGVLDSIGSLNFDVNMQLSGAIANILEAKLSVPKSRFYLKFYETKVSDQQDQQGVKTVWRVKEDIALMSSWCFVNQDQVRGKNQKGGGYWTRVHKQFHEAQAANPEAISKRNIESMKGRCKRLSENANKWIAAYKEAYVRKSSGMSHKDIENEAHSIYEAGGSKFQDYVVFNEVMCKHPKWNLTLSCDLTRRLAENEDGDGKEENGDGSKRSKTSKGGEFCILSNPETSSIPRPTAEASSQYCRSNDVDADIRALMHTSNNEVEIMRKRIDLEREKLQRNALKMKENMLNTLLAKDHLSPEDEEMKRRLIAIVFGD